MNSTKPSLKKIDFESKKSTASENRTQNSQPESIKAQFSLDEFVNIRLEKGEILNVNHKDLVEIKRLSDEKQSPVKKMLHRPSNSTFAVKFLSENLVNRSENRNSHLNDLQILTTIGNKSEFLVKFYGALFVDGSLWILTELMDVSLDRFCAQASQLSINLPEEFMSQVAFCVLSGLKDMRALKLMHRDIKPGNILLNSKGQIKLCDFGISNFTVNSHLNSFKGDNFYMAPEKINITKPGYTVKSDIWSLGVSMIEIATGSNPYRDLKIASSYELATTIVECESPRLDSLKFSQSFVAFIDLCLKKQPQERPSCEELLKHEFITMHRQKELLIAIIKLVIENLN